jgi:hypothetical protein
LNNRFVPASNKMNRKDRKDRREQKPAAEDKPLTRADLEAYRARWQAVERVELEEARQATVETRYQELDAMFEMGCDLGWIQPANDEELAPIRARWARLKADYP